MKWMHWVLDCLSSNYIIFLSIANSQLVHASCCHIPASYWTGPLQAYSNLLLDHLSMPCDLQYPAGRAATGWNGSYQCLVPHSWICQLNCVPWSLSLSPVLTLMSPWDLEVVGLFEQQHAFAWLTMNSSLRLLNGSSGCCYVHTEWFCSCFMCSLTTCRANGLLSSQRPWLWRLGSHTLAGAKGYMVL